MTAAFDSLTPIPQLFSMFTRFRCFR